MSGSIRSFVLLFKKDKPLPIKFHTPLPEHSITFYIKDTQRVSYLNSDVIVTYPRCVINGMYHIPINRYGGYDFLAIKILLQPGVLFCLTGIPSYELTNSYIDAEALWGSQVRMVCEKLANTEDLKTRLTILEQFLEHLFKGRLRRNLHPVDKAGRYILNQENAASVDWLADQSCLSRRQFIRKFEEGINPKMFERMARFERAYLMKNRYPKADWLSIAIACGYYDYQHMVKDYKKFTSHTPPSLFELENKHPYRSFKW